MHITGFLQVGVRRTVSSVLSTLLVVALLFASAGCDAAEQDVARTASSDPSFEWFEYTGNDAPKSIRLNLPFLDGAWRGTLISDGGDIRSYNHTTVRPGDEVTMLGNGGFVLMIDE